MGREDYVRDPSKFKGLRTKFRTALDAGGFKYSTALRRRHPNPAVTSPYLEVTLKKGSRWAFERTIQDRMIKAPGAWVFEGMSIVVREEVP